MPLPSYPPVSALSQEQIIQRIYDENTDQIRTSAVFTGDIQGEIECEIDATDGDSIMGVGTEDGTSTGTQHTLLVDSDLNLHVTDQAVLEQLIANVTYGIFRNIYNQVTSVPNSILTSITTYTVPLLKTGILTRVSVSGTNIASYQVRIATAIQDKRKTMYANLNEEFNFSNNSNGGFSLVAGDQVIVEVIHERPSLGDFNARIQLMEK